MRKSKILINEGDIVVLTSGRMFRAFERYHEIEGALQVQWVDESHVSMVCDVRDLHIESIFTPSASDLMTFNAARSIHERLNRLNSV